MSYVPKAIERHTIAFYERLEELGEPDSELGGVIVRVRLTEVFRDLGIPGTYYARIRAILFDGIEPCIILLHRGGRDTPSVMCVRHRPPPEIFSDQGLTTVPHTGTLVAECMEKVQRLEAWRETVSPAGFNIVEALRDHEKRLARLEANAEMTASTGETANGKKAQDTGSDR